MNEWGICMHTTPEAKSEVYSSATARGYGSLRKGSLRWEYSTQSLTCLFLDAGEELGAEQAWGGPEEVNC